MKPINGYVLIRKEEEVETMSGGIHLAQGVVTNPNTGFVTEVSEEVTKVQKGDRVMYLKNAGTSYIEDPLGSRTEYRIVKEQDILAVWQQQQDKSSQ